MSTTTPPQTNSMFFKLRTILGMFAGVLIWFVFAIPMNTPGGFTSHISILLAMLVSSAYEPKHIAGMGASIGLAAGIILGLKLLSQMIENMDLIGLLGAMIGMGLATIFYILFFAILGFIFGNVVKVYKRGAIV